MFHHTARFAAQGCGDHNATGGVDGGCEEGAELLCEDGPPRARGGGGEKTKRETRGKDMEGYGRMGGRGGEWGVERGGRTGDARVAGGLIQYRDNTESIESEYRVNYRVNTETIQSQ